MSSPRACPKCGAPMDKGCVVHHGRYDSHQPMAWVPDSHDASLDMAEGLAHEHQAYRQVFAYRCSRCGYLESYAP